MSHSHPADYSSILRAGGAQAGSICLYRREATCTLQKHRDQKMEGLVLTLALLNLSGLSLPQVQKGELDYCNSTLSSKTEEGGTEGGREGRKERKATPLRQNSVTENPPRKHSWQLMASEKGKVTVTVSRQSLVNSKGFGPRIKFSIPARCKTKNVDEPGKPPISSHSARRRCYVEFSHLYLL